MPKPTTPLRTAIAADPRFQKEIAAEVGLSETTLSLIVNGRWNADDETKTALARTLGKSVSELFPSHEAAA
jgi:DNA-binding XRE family transcriptional regulator